MLFDLPDRLIILLFILGSGILYFLNDLSGFLKKRNPGIYWPIRLMSEILGFPLLNYHRIDRIEVLFGIYSFNAQNL